MDDQAQQGCTYHFPFVLGQRVVLESGHAGTVHGLCVDRDGVRSAMVTYYTIDGERHQHWIDCRDLAAA